MASSGPEWRILRWSSERARGELTHPTRGLLAFDGSVATVDSFTEGEVVDVELAADGRVRAVRPRNVPRSIAYRAPEVTVTPTNLLDFRFESDEERDRIEDLLFDRLGIATLPHDSRTGLLRDVSELCRATLEGLTGRDIEALVHVEAWYYFDWSRVGILDRAFAPVWPKLPGLHAIVDGGAIFFGPSTVHDIDEPAPLHGRTPPFLEAWFEPHALMVSGIVSESDWSTWHAALLENTRHLPLQQ